VPELNDCYSSITYNTINTMVTSPSAAVTRRCNYADLCRSISCTNDARNARALEISPFVCLRSLRASSNCSPAICSCCLCLARAVTCTGQLPFTRLAAILSPVVQAALEAALIELWQYSQLFLQQLFLLHEQRSDSHWLVVLVVARCVI